MDGLGRFGAGDRGSELLLSLLVAAGAEAPFCIPKNSSDGS